MAPGPDPQGAGARHLRRGHLRNRRPPVLLQSEAAECGLACLAMVAAAYGHEADLNTLRHRFPVSIRGTTLKMLMEFARAMHLTPRALRLEPQALKRLHLPAILHVDMNHFVVLTQLKGEYAIIHDPAFGRRRLSAAEIDRRFTGVALELTPDPEFRAQAADPAISLRQLVGGLPEVQALLPRAILLSLFVQLLVLASPFYLQLAVDRGIAEGDRDILTPLLAGFALLLLLRSAAGWVRARLLLAFGGLFNAQLTSNVVRHMFRLPDRWFASRNVAGVLSRASSTQPLRDLVTEGLVGAIVDGAMAILTICAALLFAPSLALIILAGFTASALIKLWQVRETTPREQEQIEAQARAQQELIETVRGITTVKLFRKEGEREARWADRHADTVNGRYAIDLIRSKTELARELAQGLAMALIVYFGARQVIAGTTSLGVLMAFISYQQMFVTSASKLLDFAGRYRMARVHLHRLADVVLTEAEQPEGPSDLRLSGSVEVRDVTFRYGELEAPVLDKLSLQVAAGSFIAITGPSGGGKTTLLRLLVGLLDPNSGTIAYDGRPLREIGLPAVRSQVSVVRQDDVLLTGSIAQNISFFDSSPDMDWVRECARLAAVHDDIEAMPMRYNSLIGDMGSSLSGGQKQRVLLARALYPRPAILFMDEGTSSLDTDKEREVNANLRTLEMTRIVFAHRKDTIDAAERVYELKSGVLRQRGAA